MSASASIGTPVWWVRRAWRVNGAERQIVVQAAKTAFAVSVAWLLASVVLHAPQSFAAPYAAVFLVNDTVYRSFARAAQRTFGLVLGIVMGYASIKVIPQPYAALAVTVFVATFIGRWRRLGSSGDWVAVTALLMLTYGTAGDSGYLLIRIGQSLIGAIIGVAVNVVILPPMHLRSAHSAVRELTGRAHDLLCSLAEGIRTDWTEENAKSWLAAADELRHSAAATEVAIGRGDESIRFNPWRGLHRRSRVPAPAVHQPIVVALYQLAEQCQRIGQILVSDIAEDHALTKPGSTSAQGLSGLLAELAATVAEYREAGTWSEQTRDHLCSILSDVRKRHNGVTSEIRRGQLPKPDSWSVQGGLLLAVEGAVLALQRAADHR